MGNLAKLLANELINKNYPGIQTSIWINKEWRIGLEIEWKHIKNRRRDSVTT